MRHRPDLIFIVPAMKPKMKEESMGTLILAKKAILAGYNVKILRYWQIGISPKENYYAFTTKLITLITRDNPLAVSFYCRCEEYHICIDLAQKIKKIQSDVRIVFGGPQAELVAKETIKRFKFVDYVCCSEGEHTIVPLLELLNGKRKSSEVEGLTYRDENNNVYQNHFPSFLDDNYIRGFEYYDLIPDQILRQCKSVQIDVGRGCPYCCTFCSTKTFWKRKYRLRNYTDIIDEIKYVIGHYGVNCFDFKHDLFTASKRRILAFCDGLKKENLHISWGCDSRIGTIDKEMIDKMVDTGLKHIFFGIETGSPRMQKLINKNLDLEKADSIVKYCLLKGLEVTTSFIYGFPEEEDKDIDKTLKLAIKFQNYGVTVLTNLCHIMNGTELFNRYKGKLVLSENTAYNNSIIAFHELNGLIDNNKDMFANFCDYPTKLRDEMKYIDVYRYALTRIHHEDPILDERLHAYDYGSLALYRAFCQANKDLLGEAVPSSDGNVSNIYHVLRHLPTSLYMSMVTNLLTFLNLKN